MVWQVVAEAETQLMQFGDRQAGLERRRLLVVVLLLLPSDNHVCVCPASKHVSQSTSIRHNSPSGPSSGLK